MSSSVPLLGCDFSSSPSPRKPIVVAWGNAQAGRVHVQSLERLPTLDAFSALLAREGAWVGDILAFITIGAGFVFFLLRALGQHSLYPHRDPRILESANLSN